MKKATITQKIQEATEAKTPVRATYKITDNSIQTELRLRCEWSIYYPADEIHYPKNLARDWAHPLWTKMRRLEEKIRKSTDLGKQTIPGAGGEYYRVLPIKARTKSGPAQRAEAKSQFEIEASSRFLSHYRAVTQKRNLERVRRAITKLQAQQIELIPQLRKANSEYLSQRKTEKQAQAERNSEALASGRFWEADKEALKGYFNPPFSRNYLADVSERWRAALYTEMDSTAWKAGNGDWRHKNIGTGWGYLCGIDDNGDEWGHKVDLRSKLSQDQYSDYGYQATVEEAMSLLFNIHEDKLAVCTRQGDLLFCPCAIRKSDEQVCHNCGRAESAHIEGSCHGHPTGPWDWWKPRTLKAVELYPQEEPWEIRESHVAESVGLLRNGQYFASGNPITITHTSHQTVTLTPGEYRLHVLDIADAD